MNDRRPAPQLLPTSSNSPDAIVAPWITVASGLGANVVDRVADAGSDVL